MRSGGSCIVAQWMLSLPMAVQEPSGSRVEARAGRRHRPPCAVPTARFACPAIPARKAQSFQEKHGTSGSAPHLPVPSSSRAPSPEADTVEA
jgi:hypothetical protein